MPPLNYFKNKRVLRNITQSSTLSNSQNLSNKKKEQARQKMLEILRLKQEKQERLEQEQLRRKQLQQRKALEIQSKVKKIHATNKKMKPKKQSFANLLLKPEPKKLSVVKRPNLKPEPKKLSVTKRPNLKPEPKKLSVVKRPNLKPEPKKLSVVKRPNLKPEPKAKIIDFEPDYAVFHKPREIITKPVSKVKPKQQQINVHTLTKSQINNLSLEKRANLYNQLEKRVNILKQQLRQLQVNKQPLPFETVKELHTFNNVLKYINSIQESEIQAKSQQMLKEGTYNQQVARASAEDKKSGFKVESFFKGVISKKQVLDQQKTKKYLQKSYEERFCEKIGEKGKERLREIVKEWNRNYFFNITEYTKEYSKINQVRKMLEKVESSDKWGFLRGGVVNILELNPTIEQLKLYGAELINMLEKVESSHKWGFLHDGVISILKLNPTIEQFQEIRKMLEKVESSHKWGFLHDGVISILKLNPTIEQFQEIRKMLEKVESSHKWGFLHDGVISILKLNPTIEQLQEIINMLEKVESSHKQNFLQYGVASILKLNPTIEQFKKYYEELYSPLSKTIWDVDKNFSFNLTSKNFIEKYFEYKDFNQQPILVVDKNKPVSFSVKIRQQQQLRETSPVNKKTIQKYKDMLSLEKRNASKRYLTILQLVKPKEYQSIVNDIKRMTEIKNLTSKQILKEVNKVIEQLVVENKHSLVKPVLEQAMPFIIENRNVTIRQDTGNVEALQGFMQNLVEFLNNDLKEYVKENIRLSDADIKLINKRYEDKTLDINHELKKIKFVGDSEKEKLELRTSKNVLDVFCGISGETCLTKFHDVSYIKKKEFQPITIYNRKTGKIDGSIYCYVTKVNGERSIVLLGVEPKIRLVNRSTNKTNLTECLIEGVKEIAQQNGINKIYISGESGEISNRNDVSDILKHKYITNKKHISKEIDFPNSVSERELYLVS
jgi:hypothetical protein